MTNAFHVGLPMFHVSLERTGDADLLEVGAVFDGRYRNVPGAFRKQRLVGGIDGALGALADGFENLAGEFSGNADEEGRFDLAALVGQRDLWLERRGRFIRLKGRDRAEIRFASESVIVLEILVALGNEMARLTSNSGLRDAWLKVAGRCEVLPMDSENWFEPASDERLHSEARWYASRIGQDSAAYEDAARWLRARQMLFAVGELSAEPEWQDYAGKTRLDLPSRHEIDDLVRRAAAAIGQDIGEFVRDAIADRNNAVRQEVVFRRWYGDSRQDSFESS